MTRFTIDLLRTYHEHFGRYRPDETDEFKQRFFSDIRKVLKEKKVGATGYIYCLDGSGTLTIHLPLHADVQEMAMLYLN